MKYHTVSLLIRDEDTGREYPVYDHVSSDELGATVDSEMIRQARHLGDPSIATGVATALNPILCQELAGK